MNIFMITFLMGINAYIICLLKDIINKHLSIILLPLKMLLLDAVVIIFLKTTMSNHEVMTGIITGTLIKTVIFLTIYNNERK
tara:strand:+ start:70 stop:315 length:246 start_codon:yes stop_codon:yes gene_type:complete